MFYYLFILFYEGILCTQIFALDGNVFPLKKITRRKENNLILFTIS